VPSQDEALIRRWADAINARDADTLLELAHPQIELQTLQLGVRGNYRGREGVAAWMGELNEWDPGHRVQIERVTSYPSGKVGVFGTILIEGQPSSPYSLVARVEDGKVREMRSFPSDEPTLEKLGELD
jgi:ketosteroid isomerase-like protein